MSRVDAKYLELLRTRYRAASKKEKGMNLDEFVKTTGYGRKYAITVLTGKRGYVKGPVLRPRMTTYTSGLIQPLLTLHDLFDGICSKRLRAALDVELPRLYDSGALQVSSKIYEKLMQISPATMDRLLAGRRSKTTQSRGFTKPGTLLKHQIPVRTWADWTEDKAGFCEMDLVDPAVALSSLAPITLGPCASQTSKPAGQSVFPHRTRPKSTYSMRFAALANACLSLYWALIQTMVPSSSTISSIATAAKRRSPSPAAGRARRTTVPLSSRRTGLSCVAPLATIAMIPRNNWTSLTACTPLCISTSTSSCPA